MAKKSDYSLFINFFFNSLKNRIIHYFLGSHYSLFIIILAHYSLFIIKKGHYSLIIIPHLDPQQGDTMGKFIQGRIPNVVKVIFQTKKERIRSLWPLREVPVFKRDAIEENHCLFQ